jgi:hypothetical protein
MPVPVSPFPVGDEEARKLEDLLNTLKDGLKYRLAGILSGDRGPNLLIFEVPKVPEMGEGVWDLTETEVYRRWAAGLPLDPEDAEDTPADSPPEEAAPQEPKPIFVPITPNK